MFKQMVPFFIFIFLFFFSSLNQMILVLEVFPFITVVIIVLAKSIIGNVLGPTAMYLFDSFISSIRKRINIYLISRKEATITGIGAILSAKKRKGQILTTPSFEPSSRSLFSTLFAFRVSLLLPSSIPFSFPLSPLSTLLSLPF